MENAVNVWSSCGPLRRPFAVSVSYFFPFVFFFAILRWISICLYITLLPENRRVNNIIVVVNKKKKNALFVVTASYNVRSRSIDDETYLQRNRQHYTRIQYFTRRKKQCPLRSSDCEPCEHFGPRFRKLQTGTCVKHDFLAFYPRLLFFFFFRFSSLIKWLINLTIRVDV